MSTTTGGRGPGRPAQFDREQALDDLLSLFWRQGYDAATQAEMLGATGLSSSTLYRSFGNKADMLHAVLERYVASAAVMLVSLEDGHDGVADVHAFLDNVEALISGPMGASGCLAVETMQDRIVADPRIKNLIDGHLQRMRRGLQAALRRAVVAGELDHDPATLADAIRAGVLGVLARARTGDTADAIALLNGVRALLPHRRHALTTGRA